MKGSGELIAKFAAGLDLSRLTPSHMETCGRAFADTYAVAVAGLGEPPSQRALSYTRAGAPSGAARLWGTPFRCSIEGAALFNGVSAHALDYDDASSAMSGHPSVVLLPALVAIGEARGLDGRELAAAFLIGYEVACRLGRGLSQHHYDRGWHMTASVGTIAAAVACARLLRLSEDQIGHAIGLAVAQAAGTRASFGTDAKPFQAGHASASGARAALLAEAGFTAAGAALEGPASFSALYSDGEDLQGAFKGLGEEPFELDHSGIEIKKYPACYAVHRPLDGLFDLRSTHAFEASDVAKLVVETSYGALAPLISHLPRKASEARFSLQYALAAGLVDNQVSLASFTDDAVVRPEVVELMSRISSREAAGAMTPRWADIEVHLADSSVIRKRVETLRGAPELPLSNERLAEKVRDCLGWGNSRIEAEAVMRASLSLGSIDISTLIQRVTDGCDQEPAANLPGDRG